MTRGTTGAWRLRPRASVRHGTCATRGALIKDLRRRHLSAQHRRPGRHRLCLGLGRPRGSDRLRDHRGVAVDIGAFSSGCGLARAVQRGWPIAGRWQHVAVAMSALGAGVRDPWRDRVAYSGCRGHPANAGRERSVRCPGPGSRALYLHDALIDGPVRCRVPACARTFSTEASGA